MSARRTSRCTLNFSISQKQFTNKKRVHIREEGSECMVNKGGDYGSSATHGGWTEGKRLTLGKGIG